MRLETIPVAISANILVLVGLTALMAALGCDQHCLDRDGDGYAAESRWCPAPINADCDDRDPDKNPEDADSDGWSTCDGDCDDGDPDRHPGAYDPPCDGVDQSCKVRDELTVMSTRPLDGEQDVYYRTTILVALSWHPQDVPDTVTLHLEGADGTTQTLSPDPISDSDYHFVPEQPLTPEIAYTATLSAGGCADVDWSFATGAVGTPLEPADAEGGDFLLDLGGGDYLLPDGVGGLLAVYLKDLELVVHITDLDDDLGTATAYSGFLLWGHPPQQDLCIATSSWSGADGDGVAWDNPHFETAPFSFPFLPGGAIGVDSVGWAHDVVANGDLAPDGGSMAGITFDAVVDMRFLDLLIDPDVEDGAACELLASLGIVCQDCPDDMGPYCLDVLIDEVPAERVDLEGLHPDSGEPLDSLIEVSPEQLLTWQASGLCP
jgi:Bacterial Ig-like domain